MTEVISLAEIERHHAGEWVLVGEPQTNDAVQVQAGKVLFHSKDRDEVYRQAVILRPARFAVLYTGTMPKDTAIAV
jgi:hypothetical protein